ncbi:hypothetical protein LP421_17005 [Rhizobium sp. RCAM05350]|nr:hypothetical protein LP421_17005 [Rhizobium sp. RCAM05350]
MANANSVIQNDDTTGFIQTPNCLPQGNNYFWLQPFNDVTPGPVSGPFLVSVT